MHNLGEFGEIDSNTSFDESGVRDLDRASKFLLSDKGAPPNIDSRLLSLRERLRDDLAMSEEAGADQGGVTIIFHLVTLGDNLAPRTSHAVSQLKSDLADLEDRLPNAELRFQHHGISTLSSFSEQETVESRPDNMRLRVATEHLKFKEASDAAIRKDRFVTFYAPADDLVRSAHSHGPRLFDANVRYELKRSAINQVITHSATHEKTIKLFHLYNNGVTIAADSWSFRKGGSEIDIKRPSIINGCQTVRSLAEAKSRLTGISDSRPEMLELFESRCTVLVRLVRNSSVQVEEVVRAANTQNAMEPRNLLSNQPEQRRIESELSKLGWFYERKDGALDALREAKRSALGTPLSAFRANKNGRGSRKIRSISNKDLAASWLSFIGYSDEGKNKKKKQFIESKGGLYKKVFQQSPQSHRHVNLTSGEKESEMSVGRPPADWMLSAHLLFRIIKHLIPSAQRMRGAIRAEMREAGERDTLGAVNERIMKDDDLRTRYALSMVDHVILELAGFAIARAVGGAWLEPAAGRQLLRSGALGHLFRSGEIPDHLPSGGITTLDEEVLSDDPSLLAVRFAAYGIEMTLSDPVRKDAFLFSERKSRYLQADNILKEYPATLDRYDKYLSQPDKFTSWWTGGSIYETIGTSLQAS